MGCTISFSISREGESKMRVTQVSIQLYQHSMDLQPYQAPHPHKVSQGKSPGNWGAIDNYSFKVSILVFDNILNNQEHFYFFFPSDYDS